MAALPLPEANTAPMMENGRMVGYTSIRAKPSRD
jgi:hypothetical protein